MSFLIIFSFLYIIDFSFIIKAQDTIKDINLFCSEENNYYNSLNYSCILCDSGLINENICYNNDASKRISIYGFGPITCEENDCKCDGGSLTELDDKGMYYGNITCAFSNINVDETNRSYFIATYGTPNFPLTILSQPNRTNSEINPNNDLEPKIYDYTKNYYYYNSCINGLYQKSCQYLANLCVLSIYSNIFCDIIKNELSPKIKNEVNDL